MNAVISDLDALVLEVVGHLELENEPATGARVIERLLATFPKGEPAPANAYVYQTLRRNAARALLRREESDDRHATYVITPLGRTAGEVHRQINEALSERPPKGKTPSRRSPSDLAGSSSRRKKKTASKKTAKRARSPTTRTQRRARS